MAHGMARQNELINSLTDLLRSEARVRAAWLMGSFGRDDADEYSDVDIALATHDDGVASLMSDLETNISRSLRPIFWKRHDRAMTLNFITEGWERFDLTVVARRDIHKMPGTQVRSLFDLDGLTAEMPPVARHAISPREISELATSFLRIIGLLPIAVGRDDLFVAHKGRSLLLDLLTELMLYENGTQSLSGPLSLSRRLKADQREILTRLLPVDASWSQMIVATKLAAEHFLPRARAVAQHLGAPWPSEFEEKTLAHLRDKLGLTIRGSKWVLDARPGEK